MIEVFKTPEMKVPIKSWVTELEEGAREQANNLASLPFVFKHVALMPDCHQGYGMPIGGVLATTDAIIPNAVGVDIGCGMMAMKTDIKVEELSTGDLKLIMGEIRRRIPVGFNHRAVACEDKDMPGGALPTYLPVIRQEWNSAKKQLGTLGGGNHFIEIQKGSDGFVWVMIHSGSRNLGKKVAEFYDKEARKLNRTYHSVVDEKQELAFLPINTIEAVEYVKEMKFCLEFAYKNREMMMREISTIITEVLGIIENKAWLIYNIHHNYVTLEEHFGEAVWVHRKGATSARLGEVGIIPGSQGTCSYIVEGLGNPESFKSCSHGSGRRMGRNEATKTLNLADEIKKLDDKGIVHGIRNVKDLDEASGAYKDIDVVMENQKDLVKILVKLEPMGVIKG